MVIAIGKRNNPRHAAVAPFMRVLLPLIVVLASCSSETAPKAFDPEAKEKEQAAKERAAVNAGFEPHAPAPLKTVALDGPATDIPGSILPPSDRQYRYIGRWAAAPGRCGDGAWRFKSRDLATAGETTCGFKTVAAVPTGYRLDAVCRSEGMKTEQTIQLTFDESKRSMNVRGRTLGPATLIYCGD